MANKSNYVPLTPAKGGKTIHITKEMSRAIANSSDMGKKSGGASNGKSGRRK